MKIAIASGKGGTGKTTFSVNFTYFLREFTGMSVALVDLDVEEPNTGIFLHGERIKQEIQYRKVPVWNENICSLCGECGEVCNFNAIAFLGQTVVVYPELCHGCYMCSDICPENALPMMDVRIGTVTESRVFIPGNKSFFTWIESRLDVGREMPTPLITRTLHYLENKETKDDLVLLDAPPGTSCSMIEAVSQTEFVILVAEPTRFGLNDMTLAIEALRELSLDFAVIINKYDRKQTMIEDYCSRENIPIAGKIPHLFEAARMYARGEMMYRELPEFNRALHHIYSFLNRKFGYQWEK